jgi:hypothetical protein
MAVSQKDGGKDNCKNKEANVASVRLTIDAKLSDESHGACDNTSDEAGGANKLANGHAGAVGAHSSKCAKDIWGAISKSEESDSSQTLAQAKNCCNCAQIDAEEVARSYADGGEEEAQPNHEQAECDGLDIGEGAVVEVEVMDEAGIVVGAILPDKGALILSFVDVIAFGGFERGGAALKEQGFGGGRVAAGGVTRGGRVR